MIRSRLIRATARPSHSPTEPQLTEPVTPHPINRALLTLLENQIERTDAAIEGLGDDTAVAAPGHDCKTILEITRHLLDLRRFQLELLESPLAKDVPAPAPTPSVPDAIAKLGVASDLVRRAIAEHDPDDWYVEPATPREGLWGEAPTIVRFSRPFNDFTNHLGGIRAIRRLGGDPASRTQ